MTAPELNRDYIGPLGRIYRVEHIGQRNVVIREHPAGKGSIAFPIEQTWSWLKQVPSANEAAE